MAQWMHMLTAVLAVFAAIGIGAAARRGDWLTEEADKSLIRVVVRILFPALILKVTLGNPLLLDLRNVIVPPLVGFATVVIGFAVAALTARLFRRSADLSQSSQRRTFAFCIGLYNYSYIPVPLAGQLFGQDTVAVLFIFIVGVELAFWTIGILLLSGHFGGRWYRQLFNAPSITIAVSLAINFLGWHQYVPAFANKMFALLGEAAIPLALLLVGATIADEYRGSQLAQGWRAMILGCILRLGVLPAMFLGLLWITPASLELKRIIILQAAMPAAVFPVIVARHYGGHPATAVRVVLSTSILSLITMPLWLSAGLHLLRLMK